MNLYSLILLILAQLSLIGNLLTILKSVGKRIQRRLSRVMTCYFLPIGIGGKAPVMLFIP
jgi:hypothetical protein